MNNISRIKFVVLVLLLIAYIVFLNSCHANKSGKEVFSVAEEYKGTVYETAQELIYEVLQSTDYRNQANTVAENYTRFLQASIEYVMPFTPVGARVVPFQSFLDYSNTPSFSICLYNKEGQELVLSLQEPLYSGSAGTSQFEGYPLYGRMRCNEGYTKKDYKERKKYYLDQLEATGIGAQTASIIEASDWEKGVSDTESFVKDYLDILSTMYAYDQFKYYPIKDISLVTPEERMMYNTVMEPYALELIDEKGNIIKIYDCRSSRREFCSVLYNETLIFYCITRL